MRQWINLLTENAAQPEKPRQSKILVQEAMTDSLPDQPTKTTYTLHINGEAKLSMEDYEALIEFIHELNKENHELQIDIKEKTVPRDSTYEGQLTETIRRVDGRYRLVSKSGKNLGTYDTRAGAEKREQQVQYFKHVKEDVEIVFLDENLHKWFKEKWVRFGPDGKIRGECARGSKGEGKPKCLPQAKAHALGKKGRKSAASKKRREDPNPERRGKAKNVSTKPERKVDEARSMSTQVNENHDDDLDKFRRELLRRMGEKSAEIEANTAIQKAKDPDTWLWAVGDLVYSPKTGKTYEIKYTRVRDVRDHETKTKTPTAVYGYQRGEEDDDVFERGEFIAHKAHQSLKKITPDDKEQLDELKCWPGYTRVKGVPAGAPGSCKKKSVKESHEQCPECGGPIFTDLLLAEEKDACYRKVKSRYKVWPSAYASGALVRCRKVGASNWGNSKKK